MIPIIRWTIIQRKFSILWWSLGVFFLIFISMIFYPSFKDDAQQLQQSFDNIPDSALQFLGGSNDFFSAVGFLNSQIFFITLPMILGILAIALGSNVLGKEEQDKTIESLLARPVSRSKVLFAKALSGLLIISFITLIGLLTTLLAAKAVDLEVPAGTISLATLACYLMVLSFAAIAFFLTATGRARGGSIGIATAVAFGGYIISSLAGTVEWLSTPSKLFPFEYYKSEAILRGTYDWSNAWFFVVLTIVLLVSSWLVFRKRDLV